MTKIGLIVNPVAGMGGRVGLEGTDGEALDKARALGAGSVAPEKAVIALRALIGMRESIDIITYPCEMGEDEAKECGFEPVVIGSVKRGATTSDDTKRAARDMLD